MWQTMLVNEQEDPFEIPCQHESSPAANDSKTNSVKRKLIVEPVRTSDQRISLHTSQVAHQAGAYPSFCSMKWLGVSPPDGMLVHRRVTPSIKFAGTHLYTWVERHGESKVFLPKNTTQCPRPGLDPGPFDPETSATSFPGSLILPPGASEERVNVNKLPVCVYKIRSNSGYLRVILRAKIISPWARKVRDGR